MMVNNVFELLICGGVSFETERMIVNYNLELSGDPLLIQLVHGSIWISFVGIHLSKLFKESGIGESGEWGVQTMGGPLFAMMKCLGAVAVLLNGKVVEMMGVVTKTQW
jgi:hypothetical protein